MTYRAALVAVLKASSQPMTSAELCRAVVDGGMVTVTGKTPVRTVRAELYALARSGGVPGVQRLAVAGPTRAVRGSVRWVWAN